MSISKYMNLRKIFFFLRSTIIKKFKMRTSILLIVNKKQLNNVINFISGLIPLEKITLQIRIDESKNLIRPLDCSLMKLNNFYPKKYNLINNSHIFFNFLFADYILQTNNTIYEKIFSYKILKTTLIDTSDNVISASRDLSDKIIGNKIKKRDQQIFLNNLIKLQELVKNKKQSVIVGGGNSAKNLIEDISKQKIDMKETFFITVNDHIRKIKLDSLLKNEIAIFCIDDPVIGLGSSVYVVDFLEYLKILSEKVKVFIVCRNSIAHIISQDPIISKLVIGLNPVSKNEFIKIDRNLNFSLGPSANTLTKLAGVVSISLSNNIIIYGADGASSSKQSEDDIIFPDIRKTAYKLLDTNPPKIYTSLKEAEEVSIRYDNFMQKFINYANENNVKVNSGRKSFLKSLDNKNLF